jgi:hypothetical protein
MRRSPVFAFVKRYALLGAIEIDARGIPVVAIVT